MFWPRLGGRFAGFTACVWGIELIRSKAVCACMSIACFRTDVPALTLAVCAEAGLIFIAMTPNGLSGYSHRNSQINPLLLPVQYDRHGKLPQVDDDIGLLDSLLSESAK